MSGGSGSWIGIFIVMAGMVPLAAGQRITQLPITGPDNQVLPIDRGLDRGRPEEDIPWGNRELQARQLRRMREEHQKQVFADTARLLQLATTLKEEADKGSKPSPGELKEVDEIAKLAKRLSERIKTQ